MKLGLRQVSKVAVIIVVLHRLQMKKDLEQKPLA